MKPVAFTKISLAALLFGLASIPAEAHIGAGPTSSFAAGFVHPLSGLDHLLAMTALGLWASLATVRSGRTGMVWLLPTAFLAAMALGFAGALVGTALPMVEPAISASVLVLGLLAALAAPLPLGAGIAVAGFFALFHGHAHGAEIGGGDVLPYALGFMLATASLHGVGAAAGLALPRLARLTGAAAMLGGAWLAFAG